MIPTLKPWDLAAANLVERVAGLGVDVEEVSVSARAIAAATLRETLAHRDRAIAAKTQRAPGDPDLPRMMRETAFLRLAIEVIDPGGACTQEYEDDLRIEEEKKTLTERDR